jgi:hypothetical protein
MPVALLLLCSLGQVLGENPHEGESPIGTLWARDGSWGGVPYFPSEGDLYLFDLVIPSYVILYPLAHSWFPWHSALVVRRTTGDLALFEVGGDDHNYAVLRPPGERLPTSMAKKATRQQVWVRRIKQPLTLEQSRELMTFAETQAYKPFVFRPQLALLALPGKPMPKSSPENPRWFCSAMVVEGLIVAGLLSHDQAPRPEVLTPRDLFVDKHLDLSARWEAPVLYSPTDQPPPPGPPLAPR